MPTTDRHVPYRVREPQFLRFFWASRQITGCAPSRKNLGRGSDVGEPWRSTVHERTSIATTPKAKTSSSCVIEFGLSRFSSVARVTSYPFPCLVGLTRQNIEENSTTDKRARPSRSMRILGYSRVISETYDSIKKIPTAFRFPWIV